MIYEEKTLEEGRFSILEIQTTVKTQEVCMTGKVEEEITEYEVEIMIMEDTIIINSGRIMK